LFALVTGNYFEENKMTLLNLTKEFLLVTIVFLAFPLFVKAQTNEKAIWSEILTAAVKGNTNDLREAYDKRGLDLDYELLEFVQGGGKGSLLHHMLQSLDHIQYNKEAEAVIYFLLERCANSNIQVSVRPDFGAEEPRISLTPLELLRHEKALDERTIRELTQLEKPESAMSVERNRIAMFDRLISKFSNLQPCSKTNQKSKTDDEQVSTTDWVEKFSVGNSSVIMVKNNSKTRRIIVKGSDVFQCENVQAGGCGFKTESWVIAPEEILSLRIVPPSDSKQAHTFQYQYWAEFVK
jgi:hypothetical protein